MIDALHMVVGKLRTDTALSKEQDEILLQAGYDVTRLQANKRLVLITGHRRENFGDGFIRMVTAMKDLSENILMWISFIRCISTRMCASLFVRCLVKI